jgi:hypothetical protein
MTGAAANRPAQGVRYVLELDRAAAPATLYRGFVHLPDADLRVVVRVDGAGVAGAEVGGDAAGGDRDPAVLGKMAAALVKAATKSAAAAGRNPPRKIVRWRG